MVVIEDCKIHHYVSQSNHDTSSRYVIHDLDCGVDLPCFLFVDNTYLGYDYLSQVCILSIVYITENPGHIYGSISYR